MKNWTKLSLAGLGLVGTGLGLAFWAGASNWKRETDKLVEKLKQSALTNGGKTVSFKDIDALPAPVARYFRLVLKEGQPFIRTVCIQQQGQFWMRDKWIPFTAQQWFSAKPPGMVWDADMQVNLLLKVCVRDAYVGGQGFMQGKLLALLPVMDEQGNAELKAGAMQRYLAEAVWLPTALLPSEKLQWSAIDDERALATLTDAGLSVSLEVGFNDNGEITGIYTPGRYYREDDGSYVLKPWAGYHRAYEERSGMRIPIEGGVEWPLPNGHMPYCKIKVIGVEYEFAE